MTTPFAGKPSSFGAGRVFATGNYANPTPIRFLTPQSQGIDIKRKVESLFGENQLAVAVAAGEMEVTGKVEYSKSVARVLADLLFGDSGAAGNYAEADGEAGTVPAMTSYTITVANAATYLFDLGVIDVATGVIMSRVAAASEVAGKSYSLNATTGVYTFAAGDANTNVKISYGYSVASVGESIVLNNQLQGPASAAQVVHVLPYGAEQDMFVFPNCIFSSNSLTAKNNGFGSTSAEYTAACNTAGSLGTATFAEAA